MTNNNLQKWGFWLKYCEQKYGYIYIKLYKFSHFIVFIILYLKLDLKNQYYYNLYEPAGMLIIVIDKLYNCYLIYLN